MSIHRAPGLSKEDFAQLTYKAEPPGWEAAIWYCQSCGVELFRHEVNTARELAQDGYWRACERFNGEASARTCGQCGATHETVDLTDIRWPEVAQRVREADAPAAPATRTPMEVPAG